MVEASCHCGAVVLELQAPPETVTACNCSICRRYGVLWAYYDPSEVDIRFDSEPTDTYQWDDETIAFHRCRLCGCVTHWSPLDVTRRRMGVNARLIAPEVLAAAQIRYLDGAVTEAYVDEHPDHQGRARTP